MRLAHSTLKSEGPKESALHKRDGEMVAVARIDITVSEVKVDGARVLFGMTAIIRHDLLGDEMLF